MARFRYFRFDEALVAQLSQFDSLLDLFNHLLIRSGGDVEEALELMRSLQEDGYLPEDFDLDAFVKALEDQEYVEVTPRGMQLTRKGERGIRQSALRHVFSSLRRGEAGDHRVPREGVGNEILSEKRPWRFGDEVHDIDFTGSLLNAVRRGAEEQLEGFATGEAGREEQLPGADLQYPAPPPITLREDDLEVFETEHNTSCATALLLDVSHSMVLYGEDRITPAKQVALALTELILTRFPKDALDVIAFGDEAVEIAVRDLPYVQVGPFHTNTKAALQMAWKLLERRRTANKQIFLITDGKPTVIREPDGRIYRNTFGLDPRIVNKTLDEAVICRRKGIPITTFMVARDPYLQKFIERLTELNRGRAYFSSLNRLGEYILKDFITNRKRRVR